MNLENYESSNDLALKTISITYKQYLSELGDDSVLNSQYLRMAQGCVQNIFDLEGGSGTVLSRFDESTRSELEAFLASGI